MNGAEEAETENVWDENAWVGLGNKDRGKGWSRQDLKGLGWKTKEFEEPEFKFMFLSSVYETFSKIGNIGIRIKRGK